MSLREWGSRWRNGSSGWRGRGSGLRLSSLAIHRQAGLVLAVFLLISCAAPTPSIPTPDPFPVHLRAGDVYAADGARTAAEGAFQQAAAVRPSDPTPHLRLARLYLDWNRPAEGLTAVAAAERLGAPVAQVEALRTAFYAALRDWEKAVAHGEVALALNPADGATRRRVVEGDVTLGRLEEAKVHCHALLEADSADLQAHEWMGALLALSDPAAALPHLEAAATPLASDLMKGLGECRDDPSYRLARVGQACLAYEEPALAALALERAVARSPAYADAHALLGEALGQLDRTQEALGHLETAVSLAPDSALARALLGLHHLSAGDLTAARPHLEVAYDMDPENPALSLYLAWVYAGLGQYGVAEVWLGEATRLAPEDPAVWEAVARFYLDRSLVEKQRGLEAALVLARLVPESAVARDLLGWAHFLSGRYAEAEEYLLEAAELNPALASAHYHLGEVYVSLGRVGEARAALTRALDTNTDAVLREEIEQALSRIAGR